MFSGLLTFVYGVVAAFSAWAGSLVDSLIAYVGAWVSAILDQGFGFLLGLLDSFGVLDLIGVDGTTGARAAWAAAIDYMEPVAWFLPVYPALAIVSATFAVQGSIRAVRWLLGLLPTLNLG